MEEIEKEVGKVALARRTWEFLGKIFPWYQWLFYFGIFSMGAIALSGPLALPVIVKLIVLFVLVGSLLVGIYFFILNVGIAIGKKRTKE